MGSGLIHSLIVFFVPIYHFKEILLSENAENSDLWSFSVTSFTAVILIVTLRLMLFERFFSWINADCIALLSVGLYFAYIWYANYFT